MKYEKSLRYLLLRHLYLLKDNVSEKCFRQVMNSLRVEYRKGRYQVVWKKNNQIYKKEFSHDMFDFFRRGDTKPEARALSDSLITTNDVVAKKFAEEVFQGQKEFSSSNQYVAKLTFVDIFSPIVLCFFLVIDELTLFNILALTPLFFLEHFKSGRLLIAFYLCLLSFLEINCGIFLAGLIFAFFQFADPNSEYRSIRTVTSLLATAISLIFMVYASNVSYSISYLFWGTLFFAILSTFFFSLHLSHQRCFPLVMPILFSGLTLAGFKLTAIVGILYYFALFIFAVFTYKITPNFRNLPFKP